MLLSGKIRVRTLYIRSKMKQPSTATARKQRERVYFKSVDTFCTRIGEYISLARRKRGLTQMDMAEKACTSIATYQRIEKGDGTVAFATVCRVLMILDRLESFDSVLSPLEDRVGAAMMEDLLPKRVRRKPEEFEGF